MTNELKRIKKPRIAVILVNLGTPDAPTPDAIKRYLKQFLMDPRVIEIPKFIWWFILNLIVIPLRAKRVAHAYESIWVGDSPMRKILNEQATLLDAQLKQQFGESVLVKPAMSYGQPAISNVMDELKAEGVDHFVVLPLFPQYSSTSTGAVYDAFGAWLKTQRNLPSIAFVKDYFAHPTYIQALANNILNFQKIHGKPEKLLLSFHGIPQPYADKGDPYPRRCLCTGAQVAHVLGLKDDEWATSFQSRFGKQEWVKPYTDATLKQWATDGVKHVQLVSPAFSADCLETLEELAIENKDLFLTTAKESGKDVSNYRYDYIPALNTDSEHIALMAELTAPFVQAQIDSLKGWF